MSKKEDVDIDKEVKRLSRKTDISIRKSEYSFDKQMKRLDKEMNRLMEDKISEFDENKELTQNYLNIDYSSSAINRYREKLRKM